ncbi:MAG TPA: DUF4446 family protein [Candidatus Paceibacterota bacterium]
MLIDQNILIGALAILILVLTADIFHLRRSVKKLLMGKTGNLAEAIAEVNQGVKSIEAFRKEMEAYLLGLEKRVRRSTQSVETIRFNAFKDSGVGGNQSFATAIVDENGSGVVFSSLYARERVSVFAKPLSKFASEIELSEEERKAVTGAKAKLSVPSAK